MKKFTAFVLSVLLGAMISAPALAYTDVEGEGEVAAAIATVSEKGIMEGYEDGTFKPEDAITRAEFAKVAVLTNREKNGDVVATELYYEFKDLKDDAWYVENIQLAVNQGLMKGDTEGTFRPNDTVTEAEVYTVMLRMLGYNLENDSKKWPDNYLELADALGADIELTNVKLAADRGMVAKIANWALNTPMADAEESKQVETSNYGVVTAVTDTRVTIGAMDGKVTSLRLGSLEKPEVGELVKFEATKAGELVSINSKDVKTNNDWEALISNGKIELNGKSYTMADDAVVLLINSAGGVNTVSVDKLMKSSYAAGLRSAKYTVPIQYVMSGNQVGYLLISDYAGQNELHFGFVESVGTNTDGTIVKFWGDDSDYLWDSLNEDDAIPHEDVLYAYVLKADGVRAYRVDVAVEQIDGKVTRVNNLLKEAFDKEDGNKQFIITEETVIWQVEYNDDGSIYSCEEVDGVDEDDLVRVRYNAEKKSGETGLEAAYIIIDATDK